MAGARPDLWPPITGTDLVAPVTILREQAALLGKKTKGLVLASVSTATKSRRQSLEDQDTPLSPTELAEREGNVPASDERFIHSFQLVVPALEDYAYTLFRVEHGIEFYPIKFHAPRTLDRIAHSEDEFIDILGRILSSDRTQRVLQSLIAQVQTA